MEISEESYIEYQDLREKNENLILKVKKKIHEH